MKKIILLAAAASLAAGATVLHAREDHKAYREMKPPECNECHRGSGVTPNHQAAWNAEHRLIAVKADAPCVDCHDQSWCLDCHAGGGIDRDLHTPQASTGGPDLMPKSHRSGWIEIHPIFSNDNPASCNRCHDASFCVACHGRFRPQELQFQSHRRGWSDLSAAPGGARHSTFPPDSCLTCHPGSVLPAKEWTAAHAREARRNLPSCQACHPEGDVCLKCHSARTGLRVNPHPDDWGSRQKRLNKAAGQRTCVKCH